MAKEQFTGRYFINGIDIYTNFGIGVTIGGMEELERWHKRKEQYARVFKESDGTQRSERYNNKLLFESKSVSLQFCLVFDNRADFLTKSRAFKHFLLEGDASGYFKLYCSYLEAEYTLLYDDNSDVVIPFGMFDKDGNAEGDNWVFFNVQFIDDGGVEYGHKDYNAVVLMDDLGNDLTNEDDHNLSTLSYPNNFETYSLDNLTSLSDSGERPRINVANLPAGTADDNTGVVGVQNGVGKLITGFVSLDANKKIPNENLNFGEVKEGDLRAVSGGEVFSKVVNKNDININGNQIDYTPYIVKNVTINGVGDTIASTNGRIVQDMPIDYTKDSITLENIFADNLKKLIFKDSENNIIGGVNGVVGLDVIPKTIQIPAGGVKTSFTFIRGTDPDKTLLPKVYYGDELVQYVNKITNIEIKASALTEDNITPYPINPENAINKEYFDDNAVKENGFEYEYIYSNNKLDRDYISTGKYITPTGTIAKSGAQAIVENHPISEYEGQLVTFNGFAPVSTKKLVFRDENGILVSGVLSLTTAPYTIRVPDLAVTFDMSIKSANDSVSSYDELRMNIGQESLPFEPYKENLITTILGKKIYAERAKGAESGGSGGASYDQSLNKADDVEFNSIKTAQLIYSAIQFNLPQGNGTPPVEVEVGDAWIDTSNSTIKVKLT